MLAPGDSLGRYTLLKRLASGGMGEIYLAARLGPIGFAPPVALKVLRDELATDRQFVEMLVDEAKISMFLNHQNVVSVLDFGEHEGRYYIAMEYVQGVTLKDLLDATRARGRRLDLSTATHIMLELCRALKYAHTRTNHAGEPLSIVHRDVTPGNVLLSIQGEVKLTDFGIARAKNRVHTTQAGVLKGKFGYMAPEMLRYEKIDARADLFCAGIMLYEMVTGRHPVEGAAIMEAITRLEEKDFPSAKSLAPGLPAGLDALIAKALEPQPTQRWSSASTLATSLQDLVLADLELRRDARNGGPKLAALVRELFPHVAEAPLSSEQAERLLGVARQRSDPALLAAPDDPIARIEAVERNIAQGRRARAETAATPQSLPAAPPLDHPTPPDAEQETAEHDRADLLRGAGLEPRKVNGKTGGHPSPVSPYSPHSPRSAATPAAPVVAPASSGVAGARGSARPIAGAGAGAGAGVQRVGDPATRAFALEPRAAAEVEIAFPDTSTDPRSQRAEWLDEPSLPVDSTVPLSAITREQIARAHQEERTLATAEGMVDDSRTMSLPIPEEPGWEHSPSEVRVMEPETSVADAVREYDEGMIGRAPVERVSSYDDGATAYEGGDTRQPADWAAPHWSASAAESPARAPSIVEVEPTHGERPLPAPDGDDFPTQIPSETRDATLLDGISSRDVERAKAEAAQARAKSASTVTVEDPAGDGIAETRLRADALVDSAFDLENSLGSAPRPIAGPLRVKVDPGPSPLDDFELPPVAKGPARGGIVVGVKDVRAQPDPAGAGRAGAPREPGAVGHETGRWVRGELPSNDLSWGDDAAARRAVATRHLVGSGAGPSPSNVDGRATGRVAAGSFAAGLGTPVAPANPQPPPGAPQPGAYGAPQPGAYGAPQPGAYGAPQPGAYGAPQPGAYGAPQPGPYGAPQPGAPYGAPQPGPYGQPQGYGGAPYAQVTPQGMTSPGSLQPDGAPPWIQSGPTNDGLYAPVSPRRRVSWVVPIAVGLVVLALASAVTATLFTRAGWPEITFESKPPGAALTIDGKAINALTPVRLKVKPGTPHQVELRLQGYVPRKIEPAVELGYLESRVYAVTLQRQSYRVTVGPVPGKVMVNGKVAGEGTVVDLEDLPAEGPITLRVEAMDHAPFEYRFGAAKDVPANTDVVLRADAPPPAPAPAPAPPRHR